MSSKERLIPLMNQPGYFFYSEELYSKTVGSTGKPHFNSCNPEPEPPLLVCLYLLSPSARSDNQMLV